MMDYRSSQLLVNVGLPEPFSPISEIVLMYSIMMIILDGGMTALEVSDATFQRTVKRIPLEGSHALAIS